jgi:hypothetical protein
MGDGIKMCKRWKRRHGMSFLNDGVLGDSWGSGFLCFDKEGIGPLIWLNLKGFRVRKSVLV